MPAKHDIPHLLAAAQRTTTCRTRHFKHPRAYDVTWEKSIPQLIWCVCDRLRACAHVPTHLEHARTPHTPIIDPHVYSWLLCIRARNRHLCITRHLSLRGRLYLGVHLQYFSVCYSSYNLFYVYKWYMFNCNILVVFIYSLYSLTSSIGHLVLYLVDPVSGDMTRGLEQLTLKHNETHYLTIVYSERQKYYHGKAKAIPPIQSRTISSSLQAAIVTLRSKQTLGKRDNSHDRYTVASGWYHTYPGKKQEITILSSDLY